MWISPNISRSITAKNVLLPKYLPWLELTFILQVSNNQQINLCLSCRCKMKQSCCAASLALLYHLFSVLTPSATSCAVSVLSEAAHWKQWCLEVPQPLASVTRRAEEKETSSMGNRGAWNRMETREQESIFPICAETVRLPHNKNRECQGKIMQLSIPPIVSLKKEEKEFSVFPRKL